MSAVMIYIRWMLTTLLSLSFIYLTMCPVVHWFGKGYIEHSVLSAGNTIPKQRVKDGFAKADTDLPEAVCLDSNIEIYTLLHTSQKHTEPYNVQSSLLLSTTRLLL